MTDQTRLPEGVLLAFYGDDFTGSSAVMEVMTFAGLPAVMFVESPNSCAVAAIFELSRHRDSERRPRPASKLDGCVLTVRLSGAC